VVARVAAISGTKPGVERTLFTMPAITNTNMLSIGMMDVS
jgi:hypothetical protein